MSTVFAWQQQQWQQFQQQRQTDRLPHALLLHGPEGIGKADFAQQMAHALLCVQPSPQGAPCGLCKACQLIQSGNHPDYIHIQPEEAGKAIKIDQIRALIQEMGFSSHMGRHRVILITDADQMNLAASNSLLKSLEEPQPGTVMILVSSRISRLPATIRSRCQMLRFALPDADLAVQWLKSEYGDQAETLLHTAHGAPLLARHMASHDLVALKDRVINDLLELVSGQQQALKTAATWYKLPTEARPVDWLYHCVCDLIRGKSKPTSTAVLNPEYHQLQSHMKTIDLGKLYRFYDRVSEAVRIQQTSANYLLLLEGILIAWTYLFEVPQQRMQA